ncbi:MAG: molecular chaperone HtpG [Planctomycetaceae bacterium]
MTTSTQPSEQFTFQAEISRLLHLLSHSLYQNREIALRELVSNASDALDKFRHLMLTAGTEKDEAELAISITPDEEAKVLDIADNGVGMTRQELIDNLGTIAHSGSLDYLSKLSGDQKADLSLIGQFGVGFYSAFMLAEKVVVLSHSHSEEAAWRWESDGTGNYSVEPAGFEMPRGTKIRLHLRDDVVEFLRPERLRHVLTKYSTFVPHPIYIQSERINEQRPIWVEPKAQVTDEQYEKFYQYLSHHFDEKPLWHLHLSADSPFQFHSVLYCPPTNVELLGFGKAEHGLHLCAKRVLVQNDCRQLLPEYLRFLHGLVDSADLPLNVSREALQDNTVFRKIRKVLTKRVLDHLGKIAEDDAAKYRAFIEQFGPTLREGLATDFEHRDKVASLLRFRSSHDEGSKLVSLDEYLSRAGETRDQILYAAGPELGTLRRSPNLEAFRTRGIEVLFLTDPIDEIALSTLGRYQGKEIVSVDSAEAKLPAAKKADGDEPEQETPVKEPPSGFETVLMLFREALANEVADVTKSDRLADSPVCLVSPEGSAGYSASLQKVLSMTNAGFEVPKRILEVNPGNALVGRLAELSANEQNHAFVRDCARQFYTNALLLSGLTPDPQDLVNRTQNFMEEIAGKRTSVIL